MTRFHLQQVIRERARVRAQDRSCSVFYFFCSVFNNLTLEQCHHLPSLLSYSIVHTELSWYNVEATTHGYECQEAGVIDIHLKGWLPQNSKRKALLCKKKCERKGKKLRGRLTCGFSFFSVKGEASHFLRERE